jgi:hypothetical protein
VDTLEELAQKTGVDAAGLVKEVQRFNTMARKGIEEDFGRGDNAYDHSPEIQGTNRTQTWDPLRSHHTRL